MKNLSFKKIASVILVIAAMGTMTGCDNGKTKEAIESAMDEKTDIKLTETNGVSTNTRGVLNWKQLDQLTTFSELRELMEDELKIIKFGAGSKNGSIYVDPEGNWTGNSTLYYAFQNKEFVKEYWENRDFIGKISEKAESMFSDISTAATGLYAAINCYYNILPTNSDETSGLMNYISRKEAMSALCRADTPVREYDCEKFNGVFGKDPFNYYAQQVEDCSYLKVSDNSLNPYTYNSAITRAEAVYMIVQRYFKEEYENTDVNSNPFTDCKNAGNVMENLKVTTDYSPETYSLEYCLQNTNKGVPEDLYKAMLVAYKHGVIGKQTNWNKSVLGGDMLSLLIKTYENMYQDKYPVNAKTGANAGDRVESGVEQTETVIDNTISEVESVRNSSDGV